jgi:hypothetical protein
LTKPIGEFNSNDLGGKNIMKSYCTQNSGDCSTCSLVNYGRDCRNNPLADDALAVEIVKLTEAQFQHEMSKAQTFQGLEPDRAEYWIGYARGLRRLFHGENFGTPQEHDLWLAAVDSDDVLRQQRGQGYRDGLAGQCSGGTAQ